MTSSSRWLRFNIVGAVGMAVQLTGMALLVRVGAGVAPAAVIAVSVALIHNFAWHRAWTWKDRRGGARLSPGLFGRFIGANGVVSLVGNALLAPWLVDNAHLPLLAASTVAIAACGLANWWLADRAVFVRRRLELSSEPSGPPRL
ncbi:MAG: GtrA family protein [Vicinamibacterales bacterium]